MYRLSHFAAPAILGAALFVGLPGCASHEAPVPISAQMLGSGHETVATTAPHDGTVYVYDETARKIVYTGRIDKGDSVRVDAKANRVLLNDRIAAERDMANSHEYQVFFDRNELGDAVPARHREGETPAPQPQPSNTTVIPVIPPPQPSNNTVIQPAPPQQPSNNTVIQPAPPQQPSNNTTVTPPNTTGAQPNGTVIQPNPSGGATVTTPPPQPQR